MKEQKDHGAESIYSVLEAANLLKRSTSEILDMIASGQLPRSTRKGIPAGDLGQFMRSRGHTGQP